MLEYLIVSLRDGAVELFDLSLNQELPPGGDGLLRSRVFPGLWIDPRALIVQDASRLLSALDGGMATPEYRDFQEKLSARKPR